MQQNVDSLKRKSRCLLIALFEVIGHFRRKMIDFFPFLTPKTSICLNLWPQIQSNLTGVSYSQGNIKQIFFHFSFILGDNYNSPQGHGS